MSEKRTETEYYQMLFASIWGQSADFEKIRKALASYGAKTQANIQLLQSILQKVDSAVRNGRPIAQPIENLDMYCNGENYYAFVTPENYKLTMRTLGGRTFWRETA